LREDIEDEIKRSIGPFESIKIFEVRNEFVVVVEQVIRSNAKVWVSREVQMEWWP